MMMRNKDNTLHTLGYDIAKELDDVVFIGVQEGHESGALCTFNCMKTGTTFLTNSFAEAEMKLEIIRESFGIC